MELFSNKKIEMPGKTALFSDIENSIPRAEYKESVMKAAESALSCEIPPLTATLYLDFAETGNRNRFENVYHARRRNLTALVLATVYSGDDRYVRKAIDLIWAICEETTWVIPAHNVSRGYKYLEKPLFNAFDDIPEVDLFSAGTGACLAFAYKYLGEKMDAVTGGVMTERIAYEIERRIISPFLKREMRWMFGFINNWTPWIVSNVLTCAAIIPAEDAVKLSVLSRSVTYLDRFVGTYGDDCGCNEGASYWGAAIGSLFDACELIYDITGGKIDVMSSPFLKKSCRFIADMCIDPSDNLFVNFADCAPHVAVDGDMVCRMGRRLCDGVLCDFGKKLREKNSPADSRGWINYFFTYRIIKNVFDNSTESISAEPDRCALYPDMQLAVLRQGDFALVVKGGHNRESHNHNDVGNIMLYCDKAPIIIDVGNLTYTKDTFNENRYKIWTNQSSYHNLPEIGGVMQEAGREFAANGFECNESSVTVSYGGAYPTDGGVWLALRRAEISEECVTISDKVDSDEECVFHFMTCQKPVIDGVTAQIGNVRAEFVGAEEITLDEIDVSGDEKMSHDWRTDALYRICIKSKELKTVFSKI